LIVVGKALSTLRFSHNCGQCEEKTSKSSPLLCADLLLDEIDFSFSTPHEKKNGSVERIELSGIPRKQKKVV